MQGDLTDLTAMHRAIEGYVARRSHREKAEEE
jgi:hypothetical protein